VVGQAQLPGLRVGESVLIWLMDARATSDSDPCRFLPTHSRSRALVSTPGTHASGSAVQLTQLQGGKPRQPLHTRPPTFC
jgi:hypothetical protein